MGDDRQVRQGGRERVAAAQQQQLVGADLACSSRPGPVDQAIRPDGVSVSLARETIEARRLQELRIGCRLTRSQGGRLPGQPAGGPGWAPARYCYTHTHSLSLSLPCLFLSRYETLTAEIPRQFLLLRQHARRELPPVVSLLKTVSK
jgi:hypothetical protein